MGSRGVEDAELFRTGDAQLTCVKKSVNYIGGTLVGLLLLFVAFCITDCSRGQVHHYECNVTGRQYKPAWSEVITTTHSDGQVSFNTQYHSEEYHVICEQAGEESRLFDVESSRAIYLTVTNGEAVTVRTKIGKWTHWNYIPAIVR